MNATTHPVAEEYLRRLDRAAQVLSRRERDELVAEIRSHLHAGLSADATEADVRNLLAELGPPEDIVAAARPERPATRRGPREIFAIILLLTGMPPVVGWLVGVGLLLWSPLWSRRQKLLGILVWPGGAVVALGVGVAMAPRSGSCPVPTGSQTDGAIGCTSAGPSPWSIIAIVVVLVAPVLVAGYLYRAAGHQSDPD